MSPLAPALMANRGPGPSKPPPTPKYSISSSPTGEAEHPPRRPLTAQSTVPVAGSEERPLRPPATTSVRPLFFQMNGVHHVDLSSRGTRHSSLPVFLSKAARNDFSSLSHCTN